MYDQRPTDVLRTSDHLVPWTSRNWVPSTSRGSLRLWLLNICSSSKKQKQICNTRAITSEKQFFRKTMNFCIGPLRLPWRSLVGPDIRTFRGLSQDVVCRQGVSYDNILDCNVYHPETVANHGSFIPLKYSLTDLTTQHLQKSNTFFYDIPPTCIITKLK